MTFNWWYRIVCTYLSVVVFLFIFLSFLGVVHCIFCVNETLAVCVCVCLSVCLSVCLPLCLSVSVCIGGGTVVGWDGVTQYVYICAYVCCICVCVCVCVYGKEGGW